MLLESAPRMRRTEIAPFGRSSTGRGMPDISFGSGIAKPPWALAALAPQSTQRRQIAQRAPPDLPDLKVTASLRTPYRIWRRDRWRFDTLRRAARPKPSRYARLQGARLKPSRCVLRRLRSAKASAERPHPARAASRDPSRSDRDSWRRRRVAG